VAGDTIGGHLIGRLDIHNASDHPWHISHTKLCNATANLLCTPQQVQHVSQKCTGMQMKTMTVTVLHMPS